MPFKPVTGSTVGRWIKSILTEAGVQFSQLTPSEVPQHRGTKGMVYQSTPFLKRPIGLKKVPLQNSTKGKQ